MFKMNKMVDIQRFAGNPNTKRHPGLSACGLRISSRPIRLISLCFFIAHIHLQYPGPSKIKYTAALIEGICCFFIIVLCFVPHKAQRT